jgi:DNA-binding MarR family transcriptional regulator
MLQRHANRVLRPFGLNQQQFSIIFEIAHAGRVKQKDMVNRLLLEKAHVSKFVKKLRRMDLITVKRADEDERPFWLEPTPMGKHVLEKCRRAFTRWHREWTARFDDDQLDTLLDNVSLLQTVL